MTSKIQDWYNAIGFTCSQKEAITAARWQFRLACESDTDTKRTNSRNAVTIIESFISNNVLIERWPSSMRRSLSRTTAAQPAAEFDTWGWMGQRPPHRPTQSETREAIALLDAGSLDWIDQGIERPKDSILLDEKWSSSAAWRIPQGQCRTVIELSKLPPARSNSKHYCVKVEIIEDLLSIPSSPIATQLSWQSKQESRRLTVKHERSSDKSVRIRAVFRDAANDAKVIAWVKETDKELTLDPDEDEDGLEEENELFDSDEMDDLF
ncbi:hypothetical protein BDW74DRAFT_182087 [Aspergillus multicolor]|uniref:uncharacterized protein n=1 Tax=Aspergillus multicolor TaxID=41759 RepID=UPI003CCDF8A7